MSNVYKKAELFANVAIIIVALLIGVVVVKRFLFPSQPHRPDKLISVGAKMPLPDMDWAKNRQTLLLVLAQGCRFCAESAPFYQRLAKEALGHNDVQLVAVLPQSPDEGRKYLNDLNVDIKEIKQAELASLQVTGTPTLILVDGQGLVTQAWVGKLPTEEEADVLRSLQCTTCGS
jgi:thiol-disulfide isomerase/thioredoxin